MPPLTANCPAASTNSVRSYPICTNFCNNFLVSIISPSFSCSTKEEKISLGGILSRSASIESTSIGFSPEM